MEPPYVVLHSNICRTIWTQGSVDGSLDQPGVPGVSDSPPLSETLPVADSVQRGQNICCVAPSNVPRGIVLAHDQSGHRGAVGGADGQSAADGGGGDPHHLKGAGQHPKVDHNKVGLPPSQPIITCLVCQHSPRAVWGTKTSVDPLTWVKSFVATDPTAAEKSYL